MALFQVKLIDKKSTWFTETFKAGNNTFRVTFYWPSDIEELYSALEAHIARLASANPLKNNLEQIIREYDYIAYILGYNKEQDWIPFGVSDVDAWIREKTPEATELNTERTQLLELLLWNVTINDGRTIYTSRVVGGGYLSADDGSWKLSFISSKETGPIRKNDLSLVTLQVEV